MKKLIVGFLVIGLLVIGCVSSHSPSTNTPTETPTNNSNGASTSNGAAILPNEPPVDKTWISPGKVQVGNFYPGAKAEWNLSVHNGKDTSASFLIAYRYPSHVATGYAKPISEVQDWVIITDSTPVIAPMSTKEILVVLQMPKDAAVFAENWEFWVSVQDTTQTGMVVTELCSRWLVTMR